MIWPIVVLGVALVVAMSGVITVIVGSTWRDFFGVLGWVASFFAVLGLAVAFVVALTMDVS